MRVNISLSPLMLEISKILPHDEVEKAVIWALKKVQSLKLSYS